MTISINLDRETEKMLEQISKNLGITKTEIIKNAIKNYCAQHMHEKSTAYELTKDLIGVAGTGRGDLSVRAEEILHNLFKSRAQRS
ncbi:MAG: CopG family transcriptional regulator [Nitrospirae bacterium]|nr:MAG: CopG family transcriptional regulator [Nitrospirota bacterium]